MSGRWRELGGWLTGRSTGLLVVLLFNTIFWAFLMLHPCSHDVVVTVDDAAGVCGPLVGVLLAVGAWWRRGPGSAGGPVGAGHGRGARWAPQLLAAGVLAYAVGTVIWDCYELLLHQPPFPSWADAAYLSVYPPLLCGILLLPLRRLPAVTRTRIALDGLMIMAAGVTFSWYFVLGPTIQQASGTLLAKVVGTAYPLSDLVLFLCIVLLWSRTAGTALRSVVTPLSIGMALIVAADSVFDYQNLHGGYATGGLIDPLWTLGFMLIGLGAGRLRRILQDSRLVRAVADERETDSPPVLWRTLLPYALLPLVALLVLYAIHTRGDETLEGGVYLGAALLLSLVVLRQLVALAENQRLYRRVAAQNAALADANARLQALRRELEALATTDALTDLPNHRGMVAALDQELERAHRYRRPCALLFLDLDHFKALNDTYGHAAGDAVLRALADVARTTLRGIDTLGRWGGEEFIALLPETDDAGALEVAERLRGAVAGHYFPAGGGVHLTCSVGLAAYPTHGTERDALVVQADRAMYGAKRLGRNQVRVAGEPAVLAVQVAAGADSRDESALLGMVEALAALVDARDPDAGRHGAAVATLTLRLAMALGLEAQEARLLGSAARLHDIGKVAVPDAVLQKPARLTEADWALMRTHPLVGAEVIGHVPALRGLAPVIRAHHERWDGRGYPDGLAGTAIPLGARIVAVAETYDALTSGRPYAAACAPIQALREVQCCAGTQFDPAIVAALARVMGGEGAAGAPRPADVERRYEQAL